MTDQNGIPRVDVPALVGRREAAEMLGVYPENIFRVRGLPPPLQDRSIRGFSASAAGALWPRAEIEAVVKMEQARRKREKLPSLTAARKALAEARANSPREQARRAKGPRATAAGK